MKDTTIAKEYLINLNNRIINLKLIHKSLQSSGEISGYKEDQRRTRVLEGTSQSKKRTASPCSEISSATADFN